MRWNKEKFHFLSVSKTMTFHNLLANERHEKRVIIVKCKEARQIRYMYGNRFFSVIISQPLINLSASVWRQIDGAG